MIDVVVAKESLSIAAIAAAGDGDDARRTVDAFAVLEQKQNLSRHYWLNCRRSTGHYHRLHRKQPALLNVLQPEVPVNDATADAFVFATVVAFEDVNDEDLNDDDVNCDDDDDDGTCTHWPNCWTQHR